MDSISFKDLQIIFNYAFSEAHKELKRNYINFIFEYNIDNTR